NFPAFYFRLPTSYLRPTSYFRLRTSDFLHQTSFHYLYKQSTKKQLRMRYLPVLLLLTTALHAQQIDTASVTAATQLIGLDFTAAEKDSMLDGLKDNRAGY